MEDKRIESILNQILKFTASDYEARGNVSQNGDELDAIIAGLNTLGQELHENKLKQKEKEKREEYLLEVLLKYTVLDFSKKATISENGDKIDALAAGLNAMGEEILYFMDELDKKAKQLQTTNKELESFTYSVSHDLRAPLRAVHGYSQILLEDHNAALDDEAQRILRQVMHNAKKMGNLIDNLLSYARIGRTDLKRTNINVNQLVKSIVSEVTQGEGTSAEFSIQSMDNVKADYMLLSLVFQNLITNAIKYSSKKNNPKIEVGCTNTQHGNAYYVQDNGVGFDMVYYDKLFGVFQRLHREEDFEGNGVGLAIVKRIITRHKGKVWAESQPGEGAKFYFTLG